MKNSFLPSTAFLCVLFASICAFGGSAARADDAGTLLYRDAARYIHAWNRQMTNVIVDDSRTPCVISRIYAYANVAAYESAAPGFPACRSLSGQLNGLRDVPAPDMSQRYDWRVTAIAAYKTVCEKMIFRFHRTDSLYDEQMKEIAATGVPADVMERSKAYGMSVGGHVLAWSGGDGYNNIIAGTRYVIPKGPGLWEPTPPDFVQPVDPFWSTIRPFTLRKADQFKPEDPLPFSTEPGSPFYQQVYEVYKVGVELTNDQALVARFWDCNPIHSHHFGHLHFNTRQISPGGHWINITRIACDSNRSDMMASLEAYTLVSLALADGFISSWTEKYRSNVIRPVTYINRYIDSTWKPLIQTPPFPEYISGHSTISAAAAHILTRLFGEMRYEDDSEIYLGLPVRPFNTFMDAALEAGLSRLYGGIHYSRSLDMGTKNGTQVAEHIWTTVRTRI